MRALLAGHLSTAERLASEAFSAGIRPESETATQYYAIQLLAIRREQLRMGELEDSLREQLDDNPRRPAWRAALATLLVETGRARRRRSREVDLLAADEFAEIPRDGDWIVAIVLLADLAASVDDAARAAVLHERLLPFADRTVVIGLGTVCLGSVARYLGRLAVATGDQATARGHFELALEANRELHASVQLAHTQLDYAQALGAGPEALRAGRGGARAADELHLPAGRAGVGGAVGRLRRRVVRHPATRRRSFTSALERGATLRPDVQDARDRREAVRRTRPRARASGTVHQGRGIPRGARARGHLGGRPSGRARRPR